MGDDDLPLPEHPPQLLNKLVEEFIEQFFDISKLKRVEAVTTNAARNASVTVIGTVLSMAAELGALLGKQLLEAENLAQADFNELAAVAIADMFNVPLPKMDARRGGGGNQAAANVVGEALFKAFSGQAAGATESGAGLEPSAAPAKAFLSSMAQLSLEGWLSGWLTEALSLGQLETFGDLDDTLSHVMGLGRASASVHGPLVRHLIVEPLEWFINKEHRPTLLSPAQVARQWARGRWDWPDVQEELARQGLSEERIDAVINEQRKFESADDVALYARRVDRATFDPIAYLGDAGYDQAAANLALTIANQRRLDAQEKELAAAAIAAFVAGDIDAAKFDKEVRALKMSPIETDHALRLGTLRRGFAVTPISDGEARQAVRLRLLSFSQYREYLQNRGFDAFGIATKELLLRAEIDADASAEELRARQAADRAAAKAETDAERAARVAARALADALPAYGEVRRAFVRGLVARDRLALAIEEAHPGIAPVDAAALLADADQDRAAYVAQQAAHEAALARDTDKALPLATLERSVLEGISSIESLDAELARRGYDDDARRIEIALMRGRLADQSAAALAKARAEARAAARGVSVADMERAVRLGLRTPADLAALLDRLETPAIEKGLVLDLLAVDMRRDADAAAQRSAADAAAAARAINLPLRRRLVLRGLRSIDAYSADLAAAGVSLENRGLELQLLELELADAGAAAARRATIEDLQATKEAAAAESGLTLAQVEHAVKLGILAPEDLRSFLSRRQYTEADIDTLVASVVAEIPDLRAGDSARATATRELADAGVDLGALERAVLRGLRSVDDYAAALAQRGRDPDTVTLLSQLVSEKVGVNLDALRAKIAIALGTIDNPPTVAEIDDAIRAGAVDDPSVQAFLTSIGVARDVALVYARLVRLVDDRAGDSGTA